MRESHLLTNHVWEAPRHIVYIVMCYEYKFKFDHLLELHKDQRSSFNAEAFQINKLYDQYFFMRYLKDVLLFLF